MDPEDTDQNSNDQPQEQIDENKSKKNRQSTRQPLGNRTNLNNKRYLRSSEKRADEDEEDELDLTSSMKPKRKRRRC